MNCEYGRLRIQSTGIAETEIKTGANGVVNLCPSHGSGGCAREGKQGGTIDVVTGMNAKEIRGRATGPGNGKGGANNHIRRGVDSQLGRDTSDKESGKKKGEGVRLHRESAGPREDYEG